MTAMLSTKEAAAYLGVKPDTLRQWRWMGTGPEYKKIGPSPKARVRYEPDALEKYLETPQS